MKKGDKIAAMIILGLILVSVIGFFVYKQYSKGSHHIAVIKQDGKVIKTIDLDEVKEKTEIKIPYKDKDYNTIEVEPGRIRFIDADCPDKVCVKTGWISEPGQTAVCLPHKLMIKIDGQNPKYDQISS